jgi:hypothetical protein
MSGRLGVDTAAARCRVVRNLAAHDLPVVYAAEEHSAATVRIVDRVVVIKRAIDNREAAEHVSRRERATPIGVIELKRASGYDARAISLPKEHAATVASAARIECKRAIQNLYVSTLPAVNGPAASRRIRCERAIGDNHTPSQPAIDRAAPAERCARILEEHAIGNGHAAAFASDSRAVVRYVACPVHDREAVDHRVRCFSTVQEKGSVRRFFTSFTVDDAQARVAARGAHSDQLATEVEVTVARAGVSPVADHDLVGIDGGIDPSLDGWLVPRHVDDVGLGHGRDRRHRARNAHNPGPESKELH